MTAENFPNLGKDLKIQVHKAHKSPKRFNPKGSSTAYIMKLSKIRDKEKILRTAREKKFIT